MKVFHQSGHNSVWNIDSFNDGVGDGIIFSPVHYAHRNMAVVPREIRCQSFFDPQFYLPNSQKNKFTSYDFFPETLMGGFSTIDYASVAYEAAEMCLDFQLRNDYRGVIVPCRYYADMITDYVERQMTFTVEPFLSALRRQGCAKDIFLTLPMTIAMISDAAYRTKILNWATSFRDICGVYLLVNFEERTKQVHDYCKISSYLDFVREITNSGMKVICGYTNLEGYLAALFDVFAVTVGAYENTRSFSVDKFIDDDKIQMGPAPRIYLPGLLNWVRFDTAREIMEDCPDVWTRIYVETPESESVLKSKKPPHFSQPALYKHYFRLACEELEAMALLSPEIRFAKLRDRVDEAIALHEEVKACGVQFFDANCRGEHLAAWRRALKNLQGIF